MEWRHHVIRTPHSSSTAKPDQSRIMVWRGDASGPKCLGRFLGGTTSTESYADATTANAGESDGSVGFLGIGSLGFLRRDCKDTGAASTGEEGGPVCEHLGISSGADGEEGAGYLASAYSDYGSEECYWPDSGVIHIKGVVRLLGDCGAPRDANTSFPPSLGISSYICTACKRLYIAPQTVQNRPEPPCYRLFVHHVQV